MTKRYALYDNYTTWMILGGMAGMNLLNLGVCYRLYLQFRGMLDVGFWLLIGFLMALCILADILALPQFPRFLMRCRFSPEGIFCSGTHWGKYLIPWSEIHVYGTCTSSYSYVSMKMLFFSTDKQELGPKNVGEAMRVHRGRLVFQRRKGFDEALYRYMPEDMKKKLQYVVERDQAGFFRR